jgi:hypothetical protein
VRPARKCEEDGEDVDLEDFDDDGGGDGDADEVGDVEDEEKEGGGDSGGGLAATISSKIEKKRYMEVKITTRSNGETVKAKKKGKKKGRVGLRGRRISGVLRSLAFSHSYIPISFPRMYIRSKIK